MVTALAIVLSLGLAAAVGYGAQTKKVATQVEVEGWYFDDDDNDMVMVGDVHSRQRKCEKARRVTVLRYDGPFQPPPAEGEGDEVDTVTTDRTGDWKLTIETNGGDTPNYVGATVTRKTVTTRSGQRLTCKADKAPPRPTD